MVNLRGGTGAAKEALQHYLANSDRSVAADRAGGIIGGPFRSS
jgi:hypothetical protein